MKKRLFLKLGLVALLGAGLFVAWLWWTEPRMGIFQRTAGRIQFGMSPKEVNETVGMEPGDYRTRTDYWTNYNYEHATRMSFMLKHNVSAAEGFPTLAFDEWLADEGGILVMFDGDRVIASQYTSFSQPSLKKLLRFLHLD